MDVETRPLALTNEAKSLFRGVFTLRPLSTETIFSLLLVIFLMISPSLSGDLKHPLPLLSFLKTMATPLFISSRLPH